MRNEADGWIVFLQHFHHPRGDSVFEQYLLANSLRRALATTFIEPFFHSPAERMIRRIHDQVAPPHRYLPGRRDRPLERLAHREPTAQRDSVRQTRPEQ